MPIYKAEHVRQRASGNWLSVLSALAPGLDSALRNPGKHVMCPGPGHKSKGDGFRLFKDADLTGGGVCNTCGVKPDGFELLMWVNEIEFVEALNAVGDLLGCEKVETDREKERRLAKEEAVRSALKHQGGQEVKSKPIEGVLIRHEAAPYNHKPGEKPSYYALIVSPDGTRSKHWGLDLERAIAESGVKNGEKVVMAKLGRKPVKVKSDVKDNTGRVVGEETISTHRNLWSVKRSDTATVAGAGAESSATPASNAVPVGGQPENVVPIFKAAEEPAWLAESKRKLEQQRLRSKANGAKLQRKHQHVWDACVPMSHALAKPMRLYFQNRGLMCRLHGIEETDCLRFHPEMEYWEEGEDEKPVLVGRFPAIVCAVRDLDGQLLTLHRTYLTPKGKKAKVESPKKMMSVPDGLSISGAAVQLGHPLDGVLGFAEGLETALSAFRVTQIPVWSTINATLMESVEVPEGVHTVLIWADKDKSGTGSRAAMVLKYRLEALGIRVFVLEPSMPIPRQAKGVDWNDVLMSQGSLGFPNTRNLRSFLLGQGGAS